MNICRRSLASVSKYRHPKLPGSLSRLFSTTGGDLLDFNINPETCYYRSLGLNPNTTTDLIKKSYQRLVKKNHPDVNPNPEAKEIYMRVTAAYEVLMDRNKRSKYDQIKGYKDADWGEDGESVSGSWRNQNNLLKIVKDFKDAPANSYAKVKMSDPGKHDTRPNQHEGKRINVYADEAQVATEKDQLHVLQSSDGKSHDPEELYKYYQGKYFKNPQVESVDPEAQLVFTWNLHNKTGERKRATILEYNVYKKGTPYYHFEKKEVEDREPHVAIGVMKDLKWVFGVFGVFGLVYFLIIRPKTNGIKAVTQSKNITHGEGLKDNLIPL